MKFRELSWNGFLLEIPEDMRLTAESGNLNSGYLKFEMEGFLVEVRWDPLDPRKAKSLALIADSFVKNIKKTLEKTSKKRIDIKIENVGNIFVSSHSAYVMILKPNSGLREPVYIWNCDRSKRIVVMHFTSLLSDEESENLIKRIVNSFKCHLEGDFIPWAALNLRFNLPPSFLLSERKIAVGRTHLTFNEQKFSTFAEKGKNLMIEYFSMANLIFEDTYKNIDLWFQEKYWKELKKHIKGIAFQTTETRRVMRHNVIYKYGIKKSGLLTRKTTRFENLTWYCSKSNRIYSITYTSYISRPFFLKRRIDEEEDKKIIQDFLSSFKCHF